MNLPISYNSELAKQFKYVYDTVKDIKEEGIEFVTVIL